MFKFTGSEGEKEDACNRFRETLMALPSQIECLQSIEVGINKNPAENWNLVLTAVVPTLQDVETYSKHPTHIAAARLVKSQIEARACVDYEY